MGSIMDGEATQAQMGGFLVALRFKGETAQEIAGCAEAMREHVLACIRSATTSSTPPAPAATTRTRSTSPPPPRSSPQPQARPSRSTATARVVELRLGGRARGARLHARASARADRAVDRRARLRLPLRAGAPPRDATRGAGAARARDANGLQRARAADESGRRASAGRRRLLARARADDRRRARTARREARLRRARRARDRRALARRPEPRRRGRARAGRRARRSIRSSSASPRCAPEELRGGTPAENAASIRRVFDGADGGARDAILLNAGGAIAAAGHADDLREGLELAREAVASGAAAERLDALVAFSRRGRWDALATHCAPGPERDRRDQAAVALGGRPAPAGRPGRVHRRVRARRSGGGLDPRRRTLRRHARRPEVGAGRGARRDAARERLLHRGASAPADEARRRRCRAPSAPRRRRRAAPRRCSATRRSSSSTCSSRRTTRWSCSAPSRSARR